jgi:hypothetical protein
MQELTDSLESKFGIQAKAMRHKGKVLMNEGKFQGVRDMTIRISGRRW